VFFTLPSPVAITAKLRILRGKGYTPLVRFCEFEKKIEYKFKHRFLPGDCPGSGQSVENFSAEIGHAGRTVIKNQEFS